MNKKQSVKYFSFVFVWIFNHAFPIEHDVILSADNDFFCKINYFTCKNFYFTKSNDKM